MQPEFWRERWSEGRTAFHEGKPNSYLVAHGSSLAPYKRVLVPLCGKADDLAYLAAHGHEVIGVELVEDAVKQFFAEHSAEPKVTTAPGFTVYTTPGITIFAGDYFATSAALVGPIDAIYDRAAIVALPAEMRQRYVVHTSAIAYGARPTLLITIEYAPGTMEGPPFSVDEAEVRTHYAGRHIEVLGHGPDPRGRPMTERCYWIS